VQAVAVPLLVSHGLSFTSKPRRTEQGDYELVGQLGTRTKPYPAERRKDQLRQRTRI
jgi:hypothetical protein